MVDFSHKMLYNKYIRKKEVDMKVQEILKKYVRGGMAIDFKSLFNLAKARGYYTNKADFEIALENAMDEGLVGCTRINNENRFFAL